MLRPKGVSYMSRTRSLRTVEDNWSLFAEAAEARNMTVNAWMVHSCVQRAEMDLAEKRRVEAEQAERNRLRETIHGRQS